MKKLFLAVLISFGLTISLPIITLTRPATASADTNSAACVFEVSVVETCQSSDPHVVLNLHNFGDTSQCSFAIHIDWGDGSTVQDLTVSGGPGGSEHLADHTYITPAAYQIVASGSVVSGACTITAGHYQFTLQSSAPQCTPDYCIPADWNTKYVNSLTPGVEPLNVIISARSTVPLNTILAAMSNWGEVPTGTSYPQCLSAEKANVAGSDVVQQHSWRLKGCILGNHRSLTGRENHARLWNQPISGSQFGAWFISASYETLCLDTTPDAPSGTAHVFEPFRGSSLRDKLTLAKWHCIDGGSGSIGSNGYDRGATDLVTDLDRAAQKKGWHFTSQTFTRPLNGINIGEDGAAFTGTVYLVTVMQ